jgi:hypothetical protein
VAAALTALRDDGVDAHLEHLLRVAPSPDGGHDHHPRIVASSHGVLGRRSGEAHEPHAGRDDEGHTLGEVGLVRAEVHTERGIGAVLHARPASS